MITHIDHTWSHTAQDAQYSQHVRLKHYDLKVKESLLSSGKFEEVWCPIVGLGSRYRNGQDTDGKNRKNFGSTAYISGINFVRLAIF